MKNENIYPGDWSRRAVWNNEGIYKDLRLFDQDGKFVVDPEHLKSVRLLYDEWAEYQVGDSKMS